MDQDFADLTAAWLDHREISPQRQAELLARLQTDADFRREFAETAQMRGLTRATQSAEPRWLALDELITAAAPAPDLEFEERVAAEWSRRSARHSPFSWSRWLGFGFAAFAIWISSVFAAYRFGTDSGPEVAFGQEAPTARKNPALPGDNFHPPVAILSRIVNETHSNDATQQNGQALHPGNFHLAGGLAQLDFVDGARLIVRGPASLEITSAGEARLLNGSATCSVESLGRGFRLAAPGWTIVETAGAFGLQVVGDNAELHALKGALTVVDATGHRRELAEASAVKLAGAAFEPMGYQPAFFPDLGEIQRLEREAIANRSVDWWEQAQNWSRDPETLLHYTFMSDVYRDRRVENHAATAENESHGIIIGAHWTEGRWPWKKALEFRHRTDRVLLGLPGNHPRLTLATWVRIDGFTQAQNVLLSTTKPERHSADAPVEPASAWRRGELRWVIDRSGVVQFKVATGSPESGQAWDIAATPRLFKDEAIGQWALLAVTYDAATGAVTHFWNGKPVAKSLMSNAAPLAFEYLELGNPGLNETDRRRLDRFGFFGALDELLISRRILEEREIAALFVNGKPAS